MDLPLAPVERILKKTRMRVSDDAIKEFAQFLEEIVADISAEAVTSSKRHGRKTVQLSDIKSAQKRLI